MGDLLEVIVEWELLFRQLHGYGVAPKYTLGANTPRGWTRFNSHGEYRALYTCEEVARDVNFYRLLRIGCCDLFEFAIGVGVGHQHDVSILGGIHLIPFQFPSAGAAFARGELYAFHLGRDGEGMGATHHFSVGICHAD